MTYLLTSVLVPVIGCAAIVVHVAIADVYPSES